MFFEKLKRAFWEKINNRKKVKNECNKISEFA